jgi:hypothetical protein
VKWCDPTYNGSRTDRCEWRMAGMDRGTMPASDAPYDAAFIDAMIVRGDCDGQAGARTGRAAGNQVGGLIIRMGGA